MILLISCSAALIVDSVLDGLVEHSVHHCLVHDPLAEHRTWLGQFCVQQPAGGRHRGLRAWARAVRVAPAAVSQCFIFQIQNGKKLVIISRIYDSQSSTKSVSLEEQFKFSK